MYVKKFIEKHIDVLKKRNQEFSENIDALKQEIEDLEDETLENEKRIKELEFALKMIGE